MRFSNQFTTPKKDKKKRAKPVPIKEDHEEAQQEVQDEAQQPPTEEEKEAAAALMAALRVLKDSIMPHHIEQAEQKYRHWFPNGPMPSLGQILD